MFRYSLIFILSLILVSCATEMPPTGGSVDADPPVLSRSKSFPDSLHLTNFKGETIELNFNEQIGVLNFAGNFSSNPTLEEIPSYKIKKNKLILTFNEELQENTTYILSLNNCVHDLTEKNKIPSVTYAFSTGTYLDSLTLSGTLFNAYENKPATEYFVALYKLSDTLNPYTDKFIYSTITKSNGDFKLTNLKPNTYHLFAFEKPKSGVLPKFGSAIAYQTIEVDSSLQLQDPLSTFIQYEDSIYVKHLSQKENYIRIRTNKDITVKVTNSLIEKTNNEYKIFPLTTDTTFIEIAIIDTYGNRLDTIATFEYNTDTLKNKITTTFEQYNNEVRLITKSELPIKYNKSKLSIVANKKDTFEIENSNNNYFLTDTIVFNNKQYSTLSCITDSLLYKNLYNTDNQYINKNSTLLNPEQSGIINGIVQSDSTNFIIQIINSKNLVVREIQNEKSFKLTFLSPDIYAYKIILDKDANNKYSEGHYFDKIQPETVIIGKTKVTLKANWEIDDLVIKF